MRTPQLKNFGDVPNVVKFIGRVACLKGQNKNIPISKSDYYNKSDKKFVIFILLLIDYLRTFQDHKKLENKLYSIAFKILLIFKYQNT